MWTACSSPPARCCGRRAAGQQPQQGHQPGLREELRGRTRPGSASLFAGNAYDAWLLIRNAASSALKVAKPGTPEFRTALRNALEKTNGLAVTNGVITFSPTNHGIYPPGTPVMLTVRDGTWALAN